MVRRAAEQGLLVASFRELLNQALAGEARAVALFRRRARLVGRAAALLLDKFDPEVLVVVEPGAGRIPECLADLREQEQLAGRLGADRVRLSRDVLDQIDKIVPSGTNLSARDAGDQPVALTDPALRRRSARSV